MMKVDVSTHDKVYEFHLDQILDCLHSYSGRSRKALLNSNPMSEFGLSIETLVTVFVAEVLLRQALILEERHARYQLFLQ